MSTIAQQQRHALTQELMTVEQTSLLTQFHVQSIYRMIRRGRLKCVKIGGWGVRIPRSEVRALRAKNPNADQSVTI